METKIFIKTEVLMTDLKEESKLVAPWVPVAVKKEEESFTLSSPLLTQGKKQL